MAFIETKWENWTQFSLENRDKYYKSVRRKEFVIPKSAILAGYTKEEFFNALKEQILSKFNLDSRDLLQNKGGLDSLLFPFLDDILWAFYNQMDYMIGNGTYRSVDTNLNVSLGGNSITASSNSLGWNWEEQSYNIFIKYKVFDEYGIGQRCWDWANGWVDYGINKEKIASRAYVLNEVEKEAKLRDKAVTDEALERINQDKLLDNKITKFLNKDDENLGQVNKIQIDKGESNILYATYQKESDNSGKLTIGVNNSSIPQGNIVNEWDSQPNHVPSTKLVQDTLFTDGEPTKGINKDLVNLTDLKTPLNIQSDLYNNKNITNWDYKSMYLRNPATDKLGMLWRGDETTTSLSAQSTKDSELFFQVNCEDKTVKYKNKEVLINDFYNQWESVDKNTKLTTGKYYLVIRYNDQGLPFRLTNPDGLLTAFIFNFIKIFNIPETKLMLSNDIMEYDIYLDPLPFASSNNTTKWRIFGIYCKAGKLKYCSVAQGDGTFIADVPVERDPYIYIFKYLGNGIPVASTIDLQTISGKLVTKDPDKKSYSMFNNSNDKVNNLKTMISNAQSRYELDQIKQHPWYKDISKNDLKELIDNMYNDKWKEL